MLAESQPTSASLESIHLMNVKSLSLFDKCESIYFRNVKFCESKKYLFEKCESIYLINVKLCEGVFVQKTASLALLENIFPLNSENFSLSMMIVMIVMMMKMTSVYTWKASV